MVLDAGPKRKFHVHERNLCESAADVAVEPTLGCYPSPRRPAVVGRGSGSLPSPAVWLASRASRWPMWRVGVVCHQRPERSFHLGGRPTPGVCAMHVALYRARRSACWAGCCAQAAAERRRGSGQRSRWIGRGCRLPTAITVCRSVSGVWDGIQRVARGRCRCRSGSPAGAVTRRRRRSGPEVNSRSCRLRSWWSCRGSCPGAGHLLLGRLQKGVIFLVAIPLMFVIGLLLDGRLFPVRVLRAARRAGRARQPGDGGRRILSPAAMERGRAS